MTPKTHVSGKVLTNLPKGQRIITLSMPQNSHFHGRIVKHRKGSDIFECKQLFTSRYYLVFEGTGLAKDVVVSGQEIQAEVFQFQKIRQGKDKH